MVFVHDGPEIATDSALFAHIVHADPFTTYPLFPRVDSVTSGTLNGSTAHQPLVKVRMNATALSVLRSDTLPGATTFPEGAVVFKEIISGGQTMLYAVMLKQRRNALSANGWLWAEFEPDGTPFISVTRAGQPCAPCHAREEGPSNDFVRTFERQR
jgi:hypothetical protein